MLTVKTFQEVIDELKLGPVLVDHDKLVLGFTDFEDTASVIYLLKNRKMILEIGTYLGHTTQNLATFYPESTIITVDLTKEVANCMPKYQSHELLSNQDSGILIEAPNVTQYKMLSDAAFGKFKTQGITFDGIFIDGNHDKEQVERDTLNALEVLNPGGIIIWHDVYNKDNSCPKCSAEPEWNDVREYLESVPFTVTKLDKTWIAYYIKE